MDIVHPRAGTPAFRSQTALNDALLGLACDENREAWESLSATATMVLSKSGGSIRTIVTGRRIITTGVYASRKTGCGHPYESMLEKAFFMLCEVDTDVVDYLNCSAVELSWLRERELLTPQKWISPTNYDRAEVEAFGSQWMSTREAAARLEVEPRGLWRLVETYPIEPGLGRGFYLRCELERVLSALGSEHGARAA